LDKKKKTSKLTGRAGKRHLKIFVGPKRRLSTNNREKMKEKKKAKTTTG